MNYRHIFVNIVLWGVSLLNFQNNIISEPFIFTEKPSTKKTYRKIIRISIIKPHIIILGSYLLYYLRSYIIHYINSKN